ncbi:uncharacterized protein A4U43_C07F11780 [Asparagus officinalis]|uniref:Uncharacterized protein n=1 Tax=Asparagus officinalis TaxID=4686 RepID=A0A5P1EB74_ASPOF|nr:uncharacterized protein A4U43_C07F11780 [Asparagus officinalis]
MLTSKLRTFERPRPQHPSSSHQQPELPATAPCRSTSEVLRRPANLTVTQWSVACGRIDLFYELGFGEPWETSHSEHFEEEILNLRNTLLKSELEKERIALELEEEKKDRAHRERRLAEQAKKIANLSSLVLCSEKDEKSTNLSSGVLVDFACYLLCAFLGTLKYVEDECASL